MDAIQVGIIMGSDSDLSTMTKCAEILKQFGIPYYMTVASAHRTPDRVAAVVKRAEEEDWKVIVAGAGMAAHLAGVVAAHTIIPVIGVPMPSSDLNGLDALLSTVQMPGGVPVATMGLGSAGAKNAGLLAVRILATSDQALRDKLREYRDREARSVIEKAEKIESTQ
ncbi:MAG: 5-(carboxyamino)imidazole ribonucleotide mutase [Desulfomonilaceae bacterium]|nr:5-(carboxyamino)imidazole ribonucleotide mutase [Desulfomonilaceae bacterium]